MRLVKEGIIWAGKIMSFSIIVLWVIGLITAAIMGYTGFVQLLETWGITTQYTNGWYWLMTAWYLITVIIFGAFGAAKGFGFLAKWEPKDNIEVNRPSK